ncbi:hypothetical protein LOC67_06895 [Stieleria sp. JC731]|uniref:hypothetical protein n=1 Tax=Pirellulaceae TaxID=2691357 RepID=UPI001E395F2E|nr:hypothetical protein [Stieleria sp. JC731]MCC9600283.1 hypothetical protein [Stieleria sp. JC731]
MKLPQDDRQKLLRLLDDVASSIEELLLTGLTTASKSTRQTLDVSFREASRMRLLRLGSTLRASNEELGRFTDKDPRFSAKRLTFFLNRAWMLCRGLSHALAENDEDEFDRLLWVPATEPVKKLELVTVGVSKKEVQNAYCAFEFRFRTLSKSGKRIPKHYRLVWSCIFPIKPGTEIPAEGFLHLPQRQKFKASDLMEGNKITIQNCAVAVDDFGGGRISLNEKSTVETGEAFTDWESLFHWDLESAIKRIEQHETSPFDLDIEMQEEVMFDQWTMEAKIDQGREGQNVYPLSANGLHLDAVVSQANEGKALRKKLDGYRKKKTRPTIFGLMHYEMCRLIFQPLTVFEPDGPVHLMISEDKIDRAALLQTLKFT